MGTELEKTQHFRAGGRKSEGWEQDEYTLTKDNPPLGASSQLYIPHSKLFVG